MTITLKRKGDLLREAGKLARKLYLELKTVNPRGESPGKDELVLVFNFFLKKKSFAAIKSLFQHPPPKRSQITRQYWEKIKQTVQPLTDRLTEEEFSYLLGWTGRLLQYEFSKGQYQQEAQPKI